MLHERWRVNGRKNEGHAMSERKATGRKRRFTKDFKKSYYTYE